MALHLEMALSNGEGRQKVGDASGGDAEDRKADIILISMMRHTLSGWCVNGNCAPRSKPQEGKYPGIDCGVRCASVDEQSCRHWLRRCLSGGRQRLVSLCADSHRYVQQRPLWADLAI